MSAPELPVFAAAIDAIFAGILAKLTAAKAKAEAELPGSGAKFDQAIADVQAARAAIDPAQLAQVAVSEVGGFLSGTAPIVHKGSDVSR